MRRQSKMAITIPGMRSNKPGSMDIDQLRGWAAFMDKAMIASLVVTVLAVATLGVTTWLSSRFGNAVRAHELAALERYKDMERQSSQLEQDAAAARERAGALEQAVTMAQGRAATLEREVATTRGRTSSLEQQVSAARERVVALEREAAAAQERAAAFEQAAREANERATRAAAEGAGASEKARSPQVDAAEIQRRLADLAKLVRGAAARPADPTRPSASEVPRPVREATAPEAVPTGGVGKTSPVVAPLRKFAGSKVAVFALDQVSDAAEVASTISGYLADAGWMAETWTWKGVAGIFGVVVLVREGSDAATAEAATALVEALRAAGLSVTKGDWPADWRRHRGTLEGPQAPTPTDAPIRVVIGSKPR
jgi:hypothetical protein